MAGIPAQESQSNAVVEEVNGPAGIASTISVPTTPTLPETSLIKTVCVQESNTTLSQVDSLIETHRASTSASPTSVDDDGYESDSGLSAYTTVATSVSYFTYENGRRYHRFREGIYNFPNDDPEQDREDMKHAMIHMLCGRLHFAPIRRGKIRADEGLPGTRQQSDGNGVKMLDMGTGTGIWAIESTLRMARDNGVVDCFSG